MTDLFLKLKLSNDSQDAMKLVFEPFAEEVFISKDEIAEIWDQSDVCLEEISHNAEGMSVFGLSEKYEVRIKVRRRFKV